jgi:hypothetical protein
MSIGLLQKKTLEVQMQGLVAPENSIVVNILRHVALVDVAMEFVGQQTAATVGHACS